MANRNRLGAPSDLLKPVTLSNMRQRSWKFCNVGEPYGRRNRFNIGFLAEPEWQTLNGSLPFTFTAVFRNFVSYNMPYVNRLCVSCDRRGGCVFRQPWVASGRLRDPSKKPLRWPAILIGFRRPAATFFVYVPAIVVERLACRCDRPVCCLTLGWGVGGGRRWCG